MPTNKTKPNNLINEKSPYLLQHAYNPVEWYPWGDEAFQKAREEDKPVFMSIGYSTCHWCHVMAHESFEDNEVAEILNREFVAIKVDREERPDVDAVYMEVCQALTGSGGWPMTIVMTPEKKPFFAGTYLPKESRYGMTGLLDLLSVIAQKWKTQREMLIESSEQITSFMSKRESSPLSGSKPARELIKSAKERFARSFDRKWGGFGGAPKFPIPHNLVFLMKYFVFEQDEAALNMAERTLEQMYRGGIFDHIGGGFSRYSTDEKWLVPHFEKMLYDNALLTWAYLEAYALTKRPIYQRIAQKTIEYVLSELSDPAGAFLCGQDADSDGVEGKYYVFTPAEVESVLGKDDGEKLCRRFGIEESGSFEGKSVPNLIGCANYETEDPEISSLIPKLYEYRLQRTSLHKDDKVLTSWNALMITALARAGLILSNAEYLDAAFKAQRFIAENLIDSKGCIKIRWKDGEAVNEGQLDDYAFYGLALLELYSSSFDVSFLLEAADIADKMLRLFWDEDKGGFFMYSKDAEQLITRPKPIYDGAIPSGNSAAAMLLAKLSRLTGDEKWRKSSDKQLDFITASASSQPASQSFSMLALIEDISPSAELICVTADENAPAELFELIRQKRAANLTVILKTPENQGRLERVAPFTSEYPIPKDGALYYLCRGRTCIAPVRTLSELDESLSGL